MNITEKLVIPALLTKAILLLVTLNAFAANGTVAVIPLISEKHFDGIEIVVSSTGRIWMDSNLGSQRAAMSQADLLGFGGYFQWGRDSDGHAHDAASIPTTDINSSGDMPGHGDFILETDSPWDWRSSRNDNLWQGVGGINNPCPNGFRLPTEAEWSAEMATWSSLNRYGAFRSPLRLTAAGYRSGTTGNLTARGSSGYYWSSTVNENQSQCVILISFHAYTAPMGRASGLSVRCIKD